METGLYNTALLCYDYTIEYKRKTGAAINSPVARTKHYKGVSVMDNRTTYLFPTQDSVISSNASLAVQL